MPPSFREFPLPPELVELIVSHIYHDIASLRVAILICRAFVPVCWTHLYEKVTLLDDIDNPELRGHLYPLRAEYPAVFTEQSFLCLLKETPSLGQLVKEIRICGSTSFIDEESYVESKELPIILPLLPSLASISFQRIRSGAWADHDRVIRRHHPHLLMTSQLAKAIPPGVQSMELRYVKFQNATVVDELFRNCYRLTHLALDQVTILPAQRSTPTRSKVFSTKRIWESIFPTTPPVPRDVPPAKLKSFIYGTSVNLPRLPFINNQRVPYFELSSVTSLKLYGHYRDITPYYWDTLISNTASTLQELIISAEFSNNIRRPGLWNLSSHKRLRCLTLILMNTQTLSALTLPGHLEKLAFFVGEKRLAWNHLDAYIDRHPMSVSLSRVEILLHRAHYRCYRLICWDGWDEDTDEEWKTEVINGMPLLHDRGLLSVRQFKRDKNDEPLP
ncbi:hypothetical protein BDZ89DRAFT_1075692 [Hymenopellis radicata]|nr:hypothetical protein BDZ89DRAFT_1075692 [Hymenopellis radicata]